MQIYARKDHPRLADIRRIKSAQDIVALDLGAISNLGNGWHKANIEAAGVQTYYGTNDESAARMPDINRAIATLQKNGALVRLYPKYTRLD